MDRDTITYKVKAQGDICVWVHSTIYQWNENRKTDWYANMTQEQRNEKAKQLLEEAGYNKANPLKFNLLYNTRLT